MKVAQSCPTLCNPMNCSPPGSSVHGILRARILEWEEGHALLQGIFPIQGSNLHFLGLLHWRVGSSPLAPPGKPQAFSLRMQFEMLHTKRWVELPPLKSTCVLVKATFWLRSDLPCQGQSTRREETAALSGFDRGETSLLPDSGKKR